MTNDTFEIVKFECKRVRPHIEFKLARLSDHEEGLRSCPLRHADLRNTALYCSHATRDFCLHRGHTYCATLPILRQLIVDHAAWPLPDNEVSTAPNIS